MDMTPIPGFRDPRVSEGFRVSSAPLRFRGEISVWMRACFWPPYQVRTEFFEKRGFPCCSIGSRTDGGPGQPGPRSSAAGRSNGKRRTILFWSFLET